MILVEVTASVKVLGFIFPSEPSKERVKINHVIVECRMIYHLPVKCNVIYNNYSCLQHTSYVLVILIPILPWVEHGRLAMFNRLKL